MSNQLVINISETKTVKIPVRQRSAFSRMLSSLFCCAKKQKNDSAKPIPSVGIEGDLLPQVIPASQESISLKNQASPVQRPVKQQRSRISRFISFLCCCGKPKKDSTEKLIQNQPMGEENLKKSSKNETAKDSDKPPVDKPPVDTSESMRPEKKETGLLRKLATTNHWLQGLKIRYQEMSRIMKVLTKTKEEKYLGVNEDIRIVSKGHGPRIKGLLQKKSVRKDLRLREQLLRRDWQNRMTKDWKKIYKPMWPALKEASESLCLLECWE